MQNQHKPALANCRWTEEDDSRLEILLRENSIEKTAEILSRTPFAIVSRVIHHASKDYSVDIFTFIKKVSDFVTRLREDGKEVEVFGIPNQEKVAEEKVNYDPEPERKSVITESSSF